MSITQDYEKLRMQLGNKKYEALDEYIRTFGKVHEWHQGIKDIRSIENIKEWEDKMFDLHRKCKPIFIEDVVMNEKNGKNLKNGMKKTKLRQNKENQERGRQGRWKLK